MFCTRNTSNLWKDTRENTSKTCKRHMGDTLWSDTIKHININKYWYHSLCSPYDDSYFNGMVQKKCASSQELWIGPKQFFLSNWKVCWTKGLPHWGLIKCSYNQAFFSGILQAPMAYLSHSRKISLKKRRYHQLVTWDVGWNSNLNISMAASKGLSFEPSISCHLTETSPSGICSISATWK